MNNFGWYDSPVLAEGNLVLCYWNHIVNEYPSQGVDHNDVRRYTKEHYVQACKDYMDAHVVVNPTRRFIIDLPLTEVYHAGERIAEDGYTEVIPIWKTPEWISYVVQELDSDPRVVGWYHADEPEVWGYREVVNGNVVNTSPKVPYTFLKERYDLLKSLSQKPVIAVFCDTPLFKVRFQNDIKQSGKFFDIFGFDYYPFTPSNKTVDETKFKQFIDIANGIDSRMEILFVGQGSGGVQFNNRPPTLQEHETLFKTFIKYCPPIKRYGYLLWSANREYITPEAMNIGNQALTRITRWEFEQDNPSQKVGFIKRVLILLRNMLHL
jgi:hypothetical protein